MNPSQLRRLGELERQLEKRPRQADPALMAWLRSLSEAELEMLDRAAREAEWRARGVPLEDLDEMALALARAEVERPA